jgi:hypothetical protein
MRAESCEFATWIVAVFGQIRTFGKIVGIAAIGTESPPLLRDKQAATRSEAFNQVLLPA